VDANQTREYGAEGYEGDDDEGLSEAPPLLHDASMVEDVIVRIEESSKDWQRPSDPLRIDGRHWLPHLVAIEGSGVLYVHVSSSMPKYIARRLRGATGEHRVYVALRIEALYDEDVLRILADVDAEVLVIEGESGISAGYYLAALADNSIPVAPALRRELAWRCWAQRREGTNFQKGRHSEGLLAFLLSQVAGFRIFDRNFNGATDEVDIIIRVDAFTDACWSQPGVPFVMVEAKNWKGTVGSSVVALLLRKLETRRKRTRIGLLFATSSFSPQAGDEELKEAKGDLCVAMLGPHEIEAWMNEDDLTAYLDDYVARAMMR
jgi:Restriction endonuclease